MPALRRLTPTVRHLPFLLAFLLLLACGLFPRKVSWEDAEVQALLPAVDAASEYRFAFTPVPRDADLRLETSSGEYDRMLHVDGATSRTIAFREEVDGYVWLGEQEIYTGPRKYDSADGKLFESISLTFHLERTSYPGVRHLNITYFGKDRRLAARDSSTLDLATVLPILTEWGFDVGLIGSSRPSGL